MKLTTPLDANRNELRQVRSENLATAPSTPVVGQRYFDTALKVERVWDGTKWTDLTDVWVGPSAPTGTPATGDLWYDTDDVSTLVLPLSVANGGTGAADATSARANLGVPTPISVANGGTGAVDAAAARTNLAVPRMYVDGYVHTGPFTGSYPFTTLFKCDATFMVAMSFYVGTIGAHAYGIRIDGVNTTWWAQLYFNQINTHATVCVPVVVRNLAAGAHTITYVAMQGSPTSDAGDQARWTATFVEVP